MSWTVVENYFDARCEEQELEKWDFPFTVENIPNNFADRAYHIGFGDFSGEGISHNAQETLVQTTISILLKGFRTPIDAQRSAVDLGETIVKECIKAKNRLGTDIKTVEFDRMNIQAIDATNDTIMLMEIVFQSRVILCAE